MMNRVKNVDRELLNIFLCSIGGGGILIVASILIPPLDMLGAGILISISVPLSCFIAKLTNPNTSILNVIFPLYNMEDLNEIRQIIALTEFHFIENNKLETPEYNEFLKAINDFNEVSISMGQPPYKPLAR